jgi:hypothetical protein
LRKPEIILEEIAVPIDMGHDDFLVDVIVALKQIGIARIIVDYHLVDLVQPICIAFAEALVFHAESPVRKTIGEPHETCDFVELLEI